MTTRPRSRAFLRSAASAAIAASAGAAISQTTACDYTSYRKSNGGGYDKDNFVVAKIAVSEEDGQTWFRMTAPDLGVCYGNVCLRP